MQSKSKIRAKKALRTSIAPALTLTIAFAVAACEPAARETAAGTVEIRVELPSGDIREYSAAVEANATMLNAMEVLRESGGPGFGARGAGEETLIDEIAGVKNGNPDGPYWVYAVNGRLADRGVGRLRVGDGDRVRWCYTKYEERQRCGEDSQAKANDS